MFINKLKKARNGFVAKFLGLALVFFVAAVSPAIAKTKTSKSADADTAVQGVLGKADPAFKAIFDNWSNQGKKQSVKLTIPSRKPVDNFRLTSNYGFRSDPFRGRRTRHKGIDMAGPIGTPIYATADGVVGRAQWLGGYGRYVEINHGNEIQTRYGHMSRLNVRPFQRVKIGDLIGFMGSTGRSTGSHLHYEVRIAGEAVNPLPFLQSYDFLIAQKSREGVALGGPAE